MEPPLRRFQGRAQVSLPEEPYSLVTEYLLIEEPLVDFHSSNPIPLEEHRRGLGRLFQQQGQVVRRRRTEPLLQPLLGNLLG